MQPVCNCRPCVAHPLGLPGELGPGGGPLVRYHAAPQVSQCSSIVAKTQSELIDCTRGLAACEVGWLALLACSLVRALIGTSPLGPSCPSFLCHRSAISLTKGPGGQPLLLGQGGFGTVRLSLNLFELLEDA